MAKKEKEKKAKKPDYEVQFASQAIAKKVRNKERRGKISIILIALLLCTLALAGIIWGSLQFIEYNSVQIAVGNSSRGMISLYNESNFNDDTGTQILNKQGPKKLDAWTYQWIDLDDVMQGSGTENSSTQDFIGFNFYARNTSGDDLQYISEIIIPYESKNIADAVRVMVLIYDKADNLISQECYARLGATGEAEKVVPYYHNGVPRPTDEAIKAVEDMQTTPFLEDEVNGKTVVMRQEEENAIELKSGDWHKFVVLVWLEGEDMQCENEILGGRMALTINLNSVSE